MRFLILCAVSLIALSGVVSASTDTTKTQSKPQVSKKPEATKKAAVQKKEEVKKPVQAVKTEEKQSVKKVKETTPAAETVEKKDTKALKTAEKPVKKAEAKKPVIESKKPGTQVTQEKKAVQKEDKPAAKTVKESQVVKKPVKQTTLPSPKKTGTPAMTKKATAIPAQEASQEDKGVEIEVSRAAICKAVVNHEPQESATNFTKDVKRLYCFSHIKGVKDTATIQHKWYYKDKEVGFSTLSVKSSSWRTYSYRDITEDQVGPWKVEIISDNNGNVLESLSFSIE